jgi:hypothetical protein
VTKDDASNPGYEGIHRTASANEEKRKFAQLTARSEPIVADLLLKIHQEEHREGLTIALKRKRDETVAKLEERVQKKVRAHVESLLKDQSLQIVQPSLVSAPFGSHLGGVNDATPSDMLHQFNLGLMKRSYKDLLALIPKMTKEGLPPHEAIKWRPASEKLDEVDRQLAQLNTRHNGERVNKLPCCLANALLQILPNHENRSHTARPRLREC